MRILTPNLDAIAVRTSTEVFHCLNRITSIPREVVAELKSVATHSSAKRARLCFHPQPDDIEQQMLIVMHQLAEDRPHYHPNKLEILLPIEGEAALIQQDEEGQVSRRVHLDSNLTFAWTNEKKAIHFLQIISEWFVFLEISQGPFRTDSTVYVS